MRLKSQGITLPLQRMNDEYIMRIFQAKYKAAAVAKLNRYRIHLRVTTIADITTGDGVHLSEDRWMGRRDDTRTH